MVKRPRQHQLETKSRVAFEDAIPEHWLLQRPDSDYGIDGDVVVFDERTNERKFNFLVQLKSTERSDDGLKIQISTERLREYSSYDSPVYIFGWNENSKKLFYINATEIEFDESAATHQITLDDKNEWIDVSAEKIERAVERRRALLFKKEQVGTATVLLEYSSSSPKAYKNGQLLADLLGRDRRHFRVRDDVAQADIHFKVGDDRIVVNYFGLFSRVISLPIEITDSLIFRNCIAGNLVVHLYELALPNFTSELVRCIDCNLRHEILEGLYVALFGIFIEHDNLHGISQICDFIISPDKIDSDSEYLIEILAPARLKATPEALKIIVDTLVAKVPLELGLDERRAYNTSNILGQLGRHAEAVKYLLAAFRGERGAYIESGYAYRELAACFLNLVGFILR